MDQWTPVFSWVHISDLHFGHGNAGTYADQQLVLDALRQDAAKTAGQRGIPVPDALLVTGDIAFSGGVRSPTEYRDASEYLRTLRDSLRIPRERTFVVPGNHDVQRNVDSERLVRLLITALREGKDVVDEVLILEDERKLLARRQQNYQQFAKEFVPYCLPDGDGWRRLDAWSYEIPARGLALRLVGFNTALLAAADDDRGKLGIGLGVLSQAFLHPPIGPNEVVIALGHHPLRDGWLRNESEITGWLRKHAQVYLSGHIHVHDTEQSRQGSGNSFVWLSAGAGHADGHDPVHGYNLSGLYVTDTGRIVLRVWPRSWDRRGKRFVTDTANTPDGQEFAEYELSRTIPELASGGFGSSTRPTNPAFAPSSANASGSARVLLSPGKLPPDTKRTKIQSPSDESSITILHVSDIQFGVKHRFGRLNLGGNDEKFDTLLKRLTDDLDKLGESEGLRPDLVVLTGDLAEWGKRKEYEDVYSFCVGLQEHLKLSRDRILVIPGNHDINRSLCESYFAECEGNDEEPCEPYWPKWEPYVEFFGKLYKDVERYQFKETAPYTWFELPELKLVVAGLNSTMRESHKEKDPKDPNCKFGHYGYVGEAQLDWFKKKLVEAESKGWLRIGLVHHNAVRQAVADDENLQDADILKSRIGSLLNLLFHGHTDQGSLAWLGRNLPVISTGSAAVKLEQRPEEVPNQYQIIQVRPDGFKTWAQQYTPSRRAWIADPRVFEDGRRGFHDQPIELPKTQGTFGAREPKTQRAERTKPTDDEDGEHKDRRLGTAHAPSDLLTEVMNTCRVRDESHRVQLTRVASDGPWGDYCLVTDPVRGIYLLGAYAGPMTMDILLLWVKDVHEPFRSRNHQGKISDLVVTSSEAFSDAVKAKAGQAGVQLHRRNDYENIIDVARWRELQTERLDRDPEYPRELYIPQRATLWSPVDDQKSTVYPAADAIVDMLCGDGGCFAMVLGAAGTGKTFLLREVARRMVERQSVVTPIIVELRGRDRAVDIFELVTWEFARCKVPITLPAPAFERDLHEGRIALLFDGFDELANRVRSSAIPEHFARILNAARDRARVLMTSRAEHFVSHSSALEALMSRASTSTTGLAGSLQGLHQRRLVVTQPFTREQIEDYLGRVLGSRDAGMQRMQRFANVSDLPGLAATPRMLSFLVRLTDEQLDAAARKGSAITPSELYRIVIVDHWLAQQETRLNPPGSLPGPTKMDLLDAAQRLALHLWLTTAKAIAKTDLDASTGEHLRRLYEDDADAAGQVLQSRTLLVHGEDGRLAFVHQTVMEWLVGQWLADQIRTNRADGELDRGRLTDFLIDVLRDLLGDDVLAAWANRMMAGTPGNRLAENARLALARMGRQAEQKRVDQRGQDLRGQSLEGQDLRGALLDDADLRGLALAGRDLSGASLIRAKLSRADLRGANLTDANLEGADLSFARLDRATVKGVQWAGATLLGMRAIGLLGFVAHADARFGESVAWSADPQSIYPIPAGSACFAVAFSPDDRFLVTGHGDGLLRLWDAAGTTLLRVMEGHIDCVRSVSFGPDGTLLASVSDDKTVRLWDVATGKTLRTLEGHTHWVMSVSFSPDGTRLASGSDDKTVRLWDVATGKTLRTLEGHTHWVMSVSFSPDGTRLASGSDDKTVRLWDVATGKTLRTLEGHTQVVMSVSFSPDGTRLASGSDDKTVRLWDVATGKTLRTLEGHTNLVRSVSFSPDGTRLASGSYDNMVRLWDVATGKTLRTLEGHTQRVMSVSFSPDGTRLASGSEDKTVRLWDVTTGKTLRTLEGHTHWVMSVSFSPDGTRLASGSSDNTVRLWNVATGKTLRTLEGHTNWVMSVSFSPDGTQLASGSEDKTVRLWDVATGKTLCTLQGHTNLIISLSFSPDGTRLASGSSDNTVRLWDVATGKTLRTLEGHTNWVRSVSFSPDGTRLASGSYDKTVRLWNMATGKTLRTLEGHTNLVRSVSFSPDGTRLASGSDDNTVRLWDVATGKTLRTLEGHTNLVRSVSFSPDGTRLASGSYDNTVRLWDVATGKTLHVLYGHLGPVMTVTWSPDGRFLTSNGGDGTLRIWDSTTSACLAVYVGTPNGSIVYRPSDGRYRVDGDPAGRVAYGIGLARYELGELDEFVKDGLRLRDDERLVPV